MGRVRILDFQNSPIDSFRFFNAGNGPQKPYEDLVPIHLAKVTALPEGTDFLIVTSDLQGRVQSDSDGDDNLPLMGETLPGWLSRNVIPRLFGQTTVTGGVLLVGDFYTVPHLDKRGGTGDVTSVWQAFAHEFAWVVGVPGNHDLFSQAFMRRKVPESERMHVLDGGSLEIGGLSIAGLGGIIGKITRPHRRQEEAYLQSLQDLWQANPDILLMHEGPSGTSPEQRGLLSARDILSSAGEGLIIRGHKCWRDPLAEFDCGSQVLNVHQRVVIFTT